MKPPIDGCVEAEHQQPGGRPAQPASRWSASFTYSTKLNRRLLWTVRLICMVGVSLPGSAVLAELRSGETLQATDEVTTLSVKIDVAQDGDALDEPVALDLGLGFPLWLEPVGRTSDSAIPFGAVPQQSTAKQTIAAGGSAAFTFKVSGPAGQDRFGTSPQLLDGVHVSDISRIGFLAQGDSNWGLAGYEIKVNDQLLAANDAVNQKAGDAQQTAQFQIASVGLKLSPLKKESADLKALKDASLATDKDLSRLTEVDKKIAPLASELRRWESQVAGRYPWFREAKFTPDQQGEASVKATKITLLTAAHTGAGTRNFVYFRTGGKKYLLASSTNPLSGSLGPQTFELDLIAGPLAAEHIRGFALGMLAHGEPFGKAPDRWHPQRLLAEVDGSVVYDSEEYPYDRKSLAAIRLIPPAQLDRDGQLVSNDNRTLRELFLWEAGKGLGLDLLDGRPLPLPDEDDPGYPDAEPGLPDDSGEADPDDADSGEADPDDSSPEDPGEESPDDGFPPDEDSPPDDGFPGEEDIYPPDGGGDIWPPGGGGGGGGGSGGGGGGGGWPWPPWPWPPWGSNPPPIGDPPQVQNARFTSGWRTSDTFVVEWDVAGDESQVNQYRITLYAFQPELPNPTQVQLGTQTAGVGVRSTTFAAAGPIGNVDYFVAFVAAELNNGTVHADRTPARAVFPPTTDPIQHRLQISPLVFRHQPKGAPPQPWQTGPISVGSEPGGSRGVWTFGREQSHIDFEFDDPFPGPAWNVALRPDPSDARMECSLFVWFFVPAGPPQKFKFVTYVGFAKGKGAVNTADFGVTTYLNKVGGGGFGLAPPSLTVTHPLGGVPQPMRKIEWTFDSSNLSMGPGLYRLQIDPNISGGEFDPNHPPAFFGTRFIPQ